MKLHKISLLILFINLVNANYKELQILNTNLSQLAAKTCAIETPGKIKYVMGRPQRLGYQAEIDENRIKIADQYHPEIIKIITKDGTELSSYLIVRKNAKFVIFICHGYWLHKEGMLSWVKLFDKNTMFLPDLRTHGSSKGTVISFGYYETQDIAACVNMLKSDPRTKDLPIIGFGASMAAAILLKAVYEGVKFDGLILDSSLVLIDKAICYLFNRWSGIQFCSCAEVANEYEKMIHFKIKELDQFKYIQNINIPILIIHSVGDRMVPINDVKKLYDAKVNGPKDIWIINDKTIGHVAILKSLPEEYKDRVKNFFNLIVSKK